MPNNHPPPSSLSQSAALLKTSWPDKDITLPGRHITLAPLESTHTKALWEIISSPSVTSAPFWTYLHTTPWPTPTDLERIIISRKQCQDGVFYAMLDSHAPNKPQGWIGVRHIDLRNGKGDLGIFLPDPKVQRTAVATEAVFLLLRYLFETLGFAAVGWMTDVENAPSRSAAERLGFGIDVEAVVDGTEVGIEPVYYTMLRGEWVVVKKALEAWLCSENFDGNGRQRHRLVDIRRDVAAEMYLGSASLTNGTLC